MKPIVIGPGFHMPATVLLARQVDARFIVIAPETEFEALEIFLHGLNPPDEVKHYVELKFTRRAKALEMVKSERYKRKF